MSWVTVVCTTNPARRAKWSKAHLNQFSSSTVLDFALVIALCCCCYFHKTRKIKLRQILIAFIKVTNFSSASILQLNISKLQKCRESERPLHFQNQERQNIARETAGGHLHTYIATVPRLSCWLHLLILSWLTPPPSKQCPLILFVLINSWIEREECHCSLIGRYTNCTLFSQLTDWHTNFYIQW